MDSLKSNYDSKIRSTGAKLTGSLNKDTHVKYFADELSGSSKLQALRKLKDMGLSVKDRRHFAENVSEISRVFGVKKEGNIEPSKSELRRMAKREKLKMNRAGNDSNGAAEEIKNSKNNRVSHVFSDKKENQESSIGAYLHSDENDHIVTALGKTSGGVSSGSRAKSNDAVVEKRNNVTPITKTGNRKNSSTGSTPVSLAA